MFNSLADLGKTLGIMVAGGVATYGAIKGIEAIADAIWGDDTPAPRKRSHSKKKSAARTRRPVPAHAAAKA